MEKKSGSRSPPPHNPEANGQNLQEERKHSEEQEAQQYNPPQTKSPSRSKEKSQEQMQTRHSRSRSNSRRGRSKYSRSEDRNEGKTLYIANLSRRITQRDLEMKFERYGRISSCQIVIDPITKESRGFAFLTFEEKEHAQEALRYSSKDIVVQLSRRNKARVATPGMYLGKPRASRRYFRGRSPSYSPHRRSRGYSREKHRHRHHHRPGHRNPRGPRDRKIRRTVE